MTCTGRLEAIMRAKKRLLEFDDDFDDDNGSIHSSELSVTTRFCSQFDALSYHRGPECTCDFRLFHFRH